MAAVASGGRPTFGRHRHRHRRLCSRHPRSRDRVTRAATIDSSDRGATARCNRSVGSHQFAPRARRPVCAHARHRVRVPRSLHHSGGLLLAARLVSVGAAPPVADDVSMLNVRCAAPFIAAIVAAGHDVCVGFSHRRRAHSVRNDSHEETRPASDIHQCKNIESRFSFCCLRTLQFVSLYQNNVRARLAQDSATSSNFHFQLDHATLSGAASSRWRICRLYCRRRQARVARLSALCVEHGANARCAPPLSRYGADGRAHTAVLGRLL